MFATIVWTAVTITITFIIIKRFSVFVFPKKKKLLVLMQKNMVFRPHMRLLHHGYLQHHDNGCQRKYRSRCFGLRQSFRVPERCSCQGCGSSDHRFCKRHLQGCHHCKAVSLRSTEDCIKRPWCNRYDHDAGNGLRHPEGCRRNVPWCRNRCNPAA